MSEKLYQFLLNLCIKYVYFLFAAFVLSSLITLWSITITATCWKVTLCLCSVSDTLSTVGSASRQVITVTLPALSTTQQNRMTSNVAPLTVNSTAATATPAATPLADNNLIDVSLSSL
jgi:hypothetical protein